jgi:predicted Zn-dependent protease
MNSIKQVNNSILITVDADIINTSSQSFDLDLLKKSIASQLIKTYKQQYGKYNLDISISISILTKVSQCSHKKTLFQIVDTIAGNNPAEADFKGLRVKLNKNNIQDFITNSNFRTLSHELGHMFGLDHPHANALFESINPDANPLEKLLTEKQRQCNLMSQTWYAQKAGIPLDKAMELTESQIDLLLINYNSGVLNKNFHLTGYLWWKKII